MARTMEWREPTTSDEDSEALINNRQNGRRRGRGGARPQNGSGAGNRPEQGNRIDNRARGNAVQLHEKYKSLARDMQMQGDRVMTEYYLQFADHYFRILAENRARFEDQQPRRSRDEIGDDEFDGDERGDYQEQPERGDRQDRQDQPERQDRYERAAREDRGNRDDRGESQPRRERQDRFDRQDRGPRPERATRQDQLDWSAPMERPGEPVAPSPAAEAVAAPEPVAEATPRPRRGRPPRVRETNETVGDAPAETIDADRLPPAVRSEAKPAPVQANDAEAEEAPRPRRRRPRGEAAAVAEV